MSPYRSHQNRSATIPRTLTQNWRWSLSSSSSSFAYTFQQSTPWLPTFCMPDRAGRSRQATSILSLLAPHSGFKFLGNADQPGTSDHTSSEPCLIRRISNRLVFAVFPTSISLRSRTPSLNNAAAFSFSYLVRRSLISTI